MLMSHNPENDVDNVVLTRVLVPALSAVPDTLVRQTKRFTMNLNSRSVLRVMALPYEYITVRQSAVLEQTKRLRNYESQVDELVNMAKNMHIDLSIADDPIGEGRPIFLPSVANLMRLLEVIAPADNNVTRVVNRTVTRAVSGGASIAVKSPIMTVTGSGTVLKSVANTTSKYANKRSEFDSRRLSCGYMAGELDGVPGSEALASNAREYLKDLTSRDYMVQDVDRVMIAVRTRQSRDYPKSKEMFKVHYFRWRHDVQLSADVDAIPVLLERIATYSEVPFWMINAYRSSTDVVETQIYRRSNSQATKMQSSGSSGNIRTVDYRIVSTDPFTWSQVRRINLHSDESLPSG